MKQPGAMTKIALMAALLLATSSAHAQSRGAQLERLGAARINAKLMAQHFLCPGADKDEIVSWVTDVSDRIEKRERTRSFSQLIQAELSKLVKGPIQQIGPQAWCAQQKRQPFYNHFFKREGTTRTSTP